MKQNILLLKDVESLGRTGEVVSVKSGYARNFLVPQEMGVFADEHTLRMQKRLQEERAKKAIQDKKDSEEMAKRLEGVIISTQVKVDPEGKMYGSVSAADIADLLKNEGYEVDKKYIVVRKGIKRLGTHDIAIHLKEGVETSVKLEILPDSKLRQPSVKEVAPKEKIEEPKEEDEKKDLE